MTSHPSPESLGEAYDLVRTIETALRRTGPEDGTEHRAAATLRRGLPMRSGPTQEPRPGCLSPHSSIWSAAHSGPSAGSIVDLRSEVMASLSACVILFQRWSEAGVPVGRTLKAVVDTSHVLGADWGVPPDSSAAAVPLVGGLERWSLL